MLKYRYLADTWSFLWIVVATFFIVFILIKWGLSPDMSQIDKERNYQLQQSQQQGAR